MGILQARMLEWVAMPSSRGYFQPRDQIQVSHITGGLSEPPGKPKNTGEGSLALLQGIFPTQESNQSLSPALQANSLQAELSGKPS